MKSISLSQIIGLIIASLVVGFILKAIDMSPMDFWKVLWERISKLALWAWNGLDGLALYVLMGAAIVIPIYVLMRVMKKGRG
ncbi:hypothetical protein JCM17844_12340 [Iodidimonas gelatinilytica]|uniref:DUF6460 domain-containing protein n=1 Tax=Iodidimonas gelatinilytica TaxID=1236966 RepID=A0A5A7MNR2_9PROT|nr:DUF6460 domain-containing protein [Iodidimonas gelatinilytica]GEQ97597.1 hypothetical protein JCM17844_12340 [Iodidimonas gelatinilytica]GER01932.1 hypothetical protein JCM17845_25550 [Iodidimonas gelatinilytica]